MFHINLKNRRLLCGFSQKHVADYLNITPQSVSKWENGDALPSIEYLPKLAECLRCDINTFFEPIQEKQIENNVLYEFLILMNDSIYYETKKTYDIVAFENAHPSAIATTIKFCRNLNKHKTISPKTLQGMLGCSESEARLFIKQLIIGEMLEKLDIDDTYFVIEDAVDGLVVLLKFNQTIYEQFCNSNIDFEAYFYGNLKNEEKLLRTKIGLLLTTVLKV